MIRVCALWLALASSACTSGPLAPGCNRQTGSVLPDTAGIVAAGSTVSYDVTSPINSNLHISVTWTNPKVELGLRATILACGVHVGCEVGFILSAFGTQPMARHLLVDGSRGKQYKIDVLGPPSQDQSYTIAATYDTGTCT